VGVNTAGIRWSNTTTATQCIAVLTPPRAAECQRQAIFADPMFENGYYAEDNPPLRGLEVARQVAMISYRTHNSYTTKFGRRIMGGVEIAKIEDRTGAPARRHACLPSSAVLSAAGFGLPVPLRSSLSLSLSLSLAEYGCGWR
jgi:homoserine acetyltransferase